MIVQDPKVNFKLMYQQSGKCIVLEELLEAGRFGRVYRCQDQNVKQK